MGFKYFGYFRLFFIIFGDFRLFSVISGYFQFFCLSVLGYFFLFSTGGYSVGRLFSRPTTNLHTIKSRKQTDHMYRLTSVINRYFFEKFRSTYTII